MMSFPEPGDAVAAQFRLTFKYFRRVEGTFRSARRQRWRASRCGCTRQVRTSRKRRIR
jgi:hypothetical protein